MWQAKFLPSIYHHVPSVPSRKKLCLCWICFSPLIVFCFGWLVGWFSTYNFVQCTSVLFLCLFPCNTILVLKKWFGLKRKKEEHTPTSLLLKRDLQTIALSSDAIYPITRKSKLCLLCLHCHQTSLNCLQYYWKFLVLLGGSDSSVFLMLMLPFSLSACLTSL